MTKVPIFSTRIQTGISGKSVRTQFYQYPLYQYDLSYEILRDDTVNNELKTLMGFYLARQGAYDSFLYVDPSDNTIAGQTIGSGDGNTKTFQLIRTYGSTNFNFTEPQLDIQPPNSPTPILNVYLNGVKQNSGWSVSYYQSGILTFTSAPGNGVVITADFSYYKRVCFLEFQQSSQSGSANADAFGNFMYNLWELKSLTLITVR